MEMYRQALDAAGYHHAPPTDQAVRECFVDYVDAGFWSNVDLEDVKDISTGDMCREFLRLGGKS